MIEELVKQIPMAEKMMDIKGVGIKTVSGFLAEVGGCKSVQQSPRAAEANMIGVG
jgi:hypothetical protein